MAKTETKTDSSGITLKKNTGWTIPAVPSPVKKENKSSAKSSGSQYAGKMLKGELPSCSKKGW